MNDEQDNQVSRFFLTIAVIAILILVLAGCTSQEEKREYRQAQVSMVQTQVSAKTQQDIADATARTALYEAMARVAAASPDNADAIAVALAVSSVREETKDSQPIVQLQREENEALAVVKAVAPSLLTTIGTVGVAAIQADVNKTQSNNAAMVAIADATTDADIMRSVTNMATAGLNNAGMDIGGDYYVSESIDQSFTDNTAISDSNNQISSTTQTISESYNSSESTSSSQDIIDSYNSTESTTDSYNSSESTTDSYNSTESTSNTETTTTTDSNNITETSTVTDSYNETNDTYNSQDIYNQQVYETQEGTLYSIEDLLTLIQQGIQVTVLVDGEPVTTEAAPCPDGSTGLTFGGDSIVCEG